MVWLWLGFVVLAWWGTAKSLKEEGRGFFKRQLTAGAGSLSLGLIVLAVYFFAFGPSGQDEAVAEAEVETTEIPEQLATSVTTDASDVEATEDQWAARRAEIEAGPDLGITPAQFADQFNAYMLDNDMSFSISGEIEPSGQAANSFTYSLNPHVAITGAAKIGSGAITSVSFIGQGDGTEESGALVMLGAAMMFASVTSAVDLDEALRVVIELVGEASGSSETAEREIDGVAFSLSLAMVDVLGSMFFAEPAATSE